MSEYPPRRPQSQNTSPFHGELSHSPTSSPNHPSYDLNEEEESFDRPYSLNHVPYLRDREPRGTAYSKGTTETKAKSTHENHSIKAQQLPQVSHGGSAYGGFSMPDYSGYPTDPPTFHNNISTQKQRNNTPPSTPSSFGSATHSSRAFQKPALPDDRYSMNKPNSPPPPMSPFDFNDDQDEELPFSDEQSIATFSSDKTKKKSKKAQGVWPCCCCPPCCSRKICVMITFVITVLVGVAAWLLWPKVPAGNIDALIITQDPVVNIEDLPYTYSQNFTLRIHINNYNILPLHLKKFEASGRDPNNYSGTTLGYGVKENMYLPSKSEQFFDIPYQLQYQFSNKSDPTWNRLAHACVPNQIQLTDRVRTLLAFVVSLHIPEITWISKVPAATFNFDYICN